MAKFVWTVVLAGIAIIIGVVIFAGKGKDGVPASANYTLDKSEMNFGQMTVQDVKTAEFKLTNTDSKPITIGHVQTSCNCTSAQVTIGDKASPKFNMGMHMSSSEANWQSSIEPNQTATIAAIYTPSVMPVYGSIERYVTFHINGSKEAKLTLKAYVQ